MSRPVQSLVSIELPLPPSVNKAFEARRGTHRLMKTAAYKFWLKQVQDECPDGVWQALPRLDRGTYGLWIDLPAKMVGDIDNRVKTLSDVLRKPNKGEYGLAIVFDDAHMDALYVERSNAKPGRAIATVVTMADWPSYIAMRLL